MFASPSELLKAAADQMAQHGHVVHTFFDEGKVCLNGSLIKAMGVEDAKVADVALDKFVRVKLLGADGAILLEDAQRMLANHIREMYPMTFTGELDVSVICGHNNYANMNTDKAVDLLMAAAVQKEMEAA